MYGEEVEAALRFLFHAMAPKDDPAFPLQGIPAVLYLEYVPRNIFEVMWPPVLCGLVRPRVSPVREVPEQLAT